MCLIKETNETEANTSESTPIVVEATTDENKTELTKNTEQLRSEFEIHQELYRAEIDELNQLLHAKTIQIEEFAEIFAQTNR
jgi:ribosomal protein L16 Arg81 hydroxylase